MGGIYIASKAIYGPEWRALRAVGLPITSSWIDESEPGATQDWPDLWARCIQEASQAQALVVIARPGDVLKGAWVEVGAALAAGVAVFGAGTDGHSIRHHPLFTPCADEAAAFAQAMRHLSP